jgi:hypothetical protein
VTSIQSKEQILKTSIEIVSIGYQKFSRLQKLINLWYTNSMVEVQGRGGDDQIDQNFKQE